MRSVIRFLQAERNNSAEIHRRTSRVYGENFISDGAENLKTGEPTFTIKRQGRKLKNWPKGQSFQKEEEIQINIKVHLTSLAATFFEEGIGNLVYRYNKCP
ncbi:hypothetical protein AVEN_138015-1 [Araneus ventricosus]|uniref:Uncharacterized protein n=1 Tax=Araneus ventricosus TaxID=182803 RepID=A0A4Y2LF74_ARAVE|nr:hypothetical protein AVEN_138015-1 [Araneus ventricosus]